MNEPLTKAELRQFKFFILTESCPRKRLDMEEMLEQEINSQQ